MKQLFSLFLIMAFFLLMLCFPTFTFLGASNGLLLWFQILLPTLLPFIIISNLLVRTNFILFISRLFRPLFQKLFSISESACYIVFVGFLCGYPMGAKAIGDCIKNKLISKTEGQYLLSFCNNTSLMYIISFLVMQNFQDSSLLFATLCIMLFSPILCSFIFRRKYQKTEPVLQSKCIVKQPLTFHFSLFDNSIMNGFESITKIGGYMILFSILFSIGSLFPIKWFLPILEMTSGTSAILNWQLPFIYTYPLVLGLTSFGGFCAVAQTYSMLQGSGLSIKPYIIQKLITAMVTSLFAYIYVLISH